MPKIFKEAEEICGKTAHNSLPKKTSHIVTFATILQKKKFPLSLLCSEMRSKPMISSKVVETIRDYTVNDYRTIIGRFIRKYFVTFVYRNILIEFKGNSDRN